MLNDRRGLFNPVFLILSVLLVCSSFLPFIKLKTHYRHVYAYVWRARIRKKSFQCKSYYINSLYSLRCVNSQRTALRMEATGGGGGIFYAYVMCRVDLQPFLGFLSKKVTSLHIQVSVISTEFHVFIT